MTRSPGSTSVTEGIELGCRGAAINVDGAAPGGELARELHDVDVEAAGLRAAGRASGDVCIVMTAIRG